MVLGTAYLGSRWYGKSVFTDGSIHSLDEGMKGSVLTCNDAFVLIDKIPQLLVGLHIKGALVISNPFHPREPQAVPGGKVSADDGAHICLHLQAGQKRQVFVCIILWMCINNFMHASLGKR